MQVHVHYCLINWWQIAVWASFGQVFFWYPTFIWYNCMGCNWLLHFAWHTLLLYILLVFFFLIASVLLIPAQQILFCSLAQNLNLTSWFIKLSSYCLIYYHTRFHQTPMVLVCHDGWRSSFWPSYTMMRVKSTFLLLQGSQRKESLFNRQ